MFTNNASKIFVVLLVLTVAFVTLGFASRSANIPAANRSYDGVEWMRADRAGIDFNYNLIEQVRLGRTINTSADRSYDGLEQLRADRLYGELKEHALPKYQLLEQYGAQSQDTDHQQLFRGNWLGQQNGGTADTDRAYDKLEALRLQRQR